MANAVETAGDAGGARPARYADVFGLREFRFLFAAHVLSMLGTVVAQIALSVLVYERTSSPALSALTFALGFVPYALGGSVLSSIADRFPPRATLVACDVMSAGVVAVMAIPNMPIAALLALLLVQGTIAPVFAGTRAGTLPDILPGELYVLGRSVIRIVDQGSQTVGYALGGLLLVVVTPQTALLLDAGSFVLSAVLLRLGTKVRPKRADLGAHRISAIARDSLGAVRTVLGIPRLRTLLLFSWLPPAFAVAPEALAVPYASDLGHPGTGAGLLLAAGPIGLVVGEVLAVRFLGQQTRVRLIVPLGLFAFVPLIGFAASPGLGVAIALLVLAGTGHASALGLDRLLLDAIPDDLRGRAFSVLSAGLMLTQGLGFALAGVLGQTVGLAITVAAAGVAGLAAVAALGVRLRATSEPAGVHAGSPRSAS